MEILKDKDVDLGPLEGKVIAILGFGNQARAHALNLSDWGGAKVIVALRQGSPSADKARSEGLEVMTIAGAAAIADIMMMLIPDEIHGRVFDQELKNTMKSGAALGFAHGFSVHFGFVKPRQDLDVILIAPKGPGHALRQLYKDGLGMPCVIGVAADKSGMASGLARAYAAAIGGGRAGILSSSFGEECETDLFSEQSILCGGVPALIKAGFETLVDAGYAPEVAYIECLHEVKQIADLLWEGGLEHMDVSISNTAEFGGHKAGKHIVTPAVRAAMQEILADVQSGKFAREFVADVESGQKQLKGLRELDKNHPIEAAGRTVRGMMPWLKS
jgi:ketol-acid reductoisomerase